MQLYTLREINTLLTGRSVNNSIYCIDSLIGKVGYSYTCIRELDLLTR